MNKGSSRIETGSKVAVVGGGPAGSLFAMYLLHYASEKGVHPEITIYQRRNFDEPGPAGCKGCAGVLSISLLRNLSELGLNIPEEVIQNRIESYTIHSAYSSISISNPERDVQIVSVYRGGGPTISHFEKSISFDGWLLSQAQKRGARVEYEAVSRICLDERPWIEVDGRKLEYDLVVLASGINVKPIPIVGLDYIPPKTKIMAHDELYAGTTQMESWLGNVAHAFLIPHSGIIFGTLVPKGPFISVSVLSSGKRPISVTDFLSHDMVRSVLPSRYERACGCHPRAAVGSARNYYADRFVAIGDAAVSRLYKDGIGSSLLTAREAALTVVYHGLSRNDFERYYLPLCRNTDRDNRWGRLLFLINDRAKDSRSFLRAQHRLIGDEQSNVKGPQPFTKAAWGMLTGSYSYRNIVRMSLSPASLVKLLTALFWGGFIARFSEKTTSPRRLHVGSRKVLVLGSGFGGTYVLRHLLPALNRNENVETTIVSDENFFLFSPLLHEVAMGSVETRHVAYPIRRLHWRDRFNFIQASVEKIELSNHRVITTAGTLNFDYLVLALGSVPNTPQFIFAEQQRSVFTLKTLHDAMLLRNQIIGVFEQASTEKNPERLRQLLTFVVSGAGYTGVQVATELRDFIHKTLINFYRSVDVANVRIILVEVEPKIVAELHPKFSAYALKCLEQMKIELRLNSRVTHVWEGKLEINDREIVPMSTLIWVAGMLANPRVAELDIAKDSVGRVLVNEYLEVPDFPRVYAVGDAAHFEDTRSGQPVPPRAHIAVRQAKIAANNILADIRGRDRQPYRYSNPGEMVSLGASKAMFRFHGLRLYGFVARLVCLAAYSLLVAGAYNRTRIIIDWLLSLLFGRDTALLKLTK